MIPLDAHITRWSLALRDRREADELAREVISSRQPGDGDLIRDLVRRLRVARAAAVTATEDLRIAAKRSAS